MTDHSSPDSALELSVRIASHVQRLAHTKMHLSLVEWDIISQDLLRAVAVLRAPVTPDVAQRATVTEADVERAWAAIVGADIARNCDGAHVVRGDIRTALESLRTEPEPVAWMRVWNHGPEVMRSVTLASPGSDKPSDVKGAELVPLYATPQGQTVLALSRTPPQRAGGKYSTDDKLAAAVEMASAAAVCIDRLDRMYRGEKVIDIDICNEAYRMAVKVFEIIVLSHRKV